MAIFDEINEDFGLIKSNPLIVIWWVIGLVIFFIGGSLINATLPNFQIGFPLFAIGFAFVVFGTNIYSNDKSRRKNKEISNEISKKLDAIENNVQELNQLHNSIYLPPISTEDIRCEININAIDFKRRLKEIEEKIDNVAIIKNDESKKSRGGAELIIGVLLGLWAGIMGAISISAMFELMKLNKESIDPIILLISFLLPLIFLVWFTCKCWKTYLKPISITE